MFTCECECVCALFCVHVISTLVHVFHMLKHTHLLLWCGDGEQMSKERENITNWETSNWKGFSFRLSFILFVWVFILRWCCCSSFVLYVSMCLCWNNPEKNVEFIVYIKYYWEMVIILQFIVQNFEFEANINWFSV